jgi:histidinol-phosphate aminotransferase
MQALDLEKLIRPSVLGLSAYSSARSLLTNGRVFLDANEAPDGRYNRYPEPQPALLVERLSQIYGVSTDQLLIGRGADEAIDTLTRALCEPERDSVLITPPTYGMYEVSAAIQNASVTRTPLMLKDNTWSLDIKVMVNAAKEKSTKIIYVCSPNNPTGSVFAPRDIAQLCQSLSTNSVVVVDEAYGEFAPESSSISLLAKFSNLVVLRTLSKAWALAGLRCGVMLGHPTLIKVLQKVRAPYPLPQPVIDAALAAIDDEGLRKMQKRVATINRERERLSQALSTSPLVETTYPSQTNFILARFYNEPSVMQAFKSEGIILRSRTLEPRLENCIRITVGSPSENNLVISMLGSLEERMLL